MHAAFNMESRMKFANAIKLHRKSGVAEGSAVSLGPHANADSRSLTTPQLAPNVDNVCTGRHGAAGLSRASLAASRKASKGH